MRLLNTVVKGDPKQKVMFEQRTEGSEGASERKEHSRQMKYKNEIKLLRQELAQSPRSAAEVEKEKEEA